MNFKVIDEKNGTVQGFALVRSCDKKTSKNGSFYLDIILSDSDGEINAKVWDYKGDDAAALSMSSSSMRISGRSGLA